MTVRLHLAPRTDLLADALGELLAVPDGDPFAEELVVVPARGVERWLTQRLAHRLGSGEGRGDGVCAGVRFVNPHSLVALLLGTEDDDPWHPDTMVWPLLEVIDAAVGEPGFEALSAHLGHGDPDDPRSARRYAVARRLAGLLSSYAVQRPALLVDWRSGGVNGGATDGAGAPLAADLAWQAELWRRLLARTGWQPPDLRHADTLDRLRAGGDGLDLPRRVSLFGHTRIPATEAELLGALGTTREVHLWLPQASTALWTELADSAAEGPVPRVADRTADRVGHPLLASLGRDARELRRTLGATAAEESVVEDPAPLPETLLGWLQADLRAAREPEPAVREARQLVPGDRSVQVHACHGAARQVDVLREVLVGLLEDDPTLEPRDIIVMCPDIESFAPLVSAGFGLADLAEGLADGRDGHPAHRLRVRLADRSPGATNPLLAVAATLVELAGGRLRSTDVLDLAGSEPVRRRFGLDDDALERLTAWVQEAAVRWGWDAAQRHAFGVDLGENTWRAGLQRVLLGAAISGGGHRHVGGALPVDDVGDGDLELVGRFAELLERLHAVLARAATATSVQDWITVLDDGVRGLTATRPEDSWQTAQLERELSRIAGGVERPDTPLRHADVRSLLAHRLRGRPTRANFRTGTLTVATLVPMRSVPHRVVCLVGLDDGVFPRTEGQDGDDVLARAPRTGERDVRAEDRQLFLDAVTAATETLVVTYTGRGEHTGAERPPAVPLGELLDALDRTAEPTDGSRVSERVTVQHPLQPHDEANMSGGRPFTFDTSALAGALAARSPRPRVRELVPAPLPSGATAGDEVSLGDLHEFFAHPVRAFCRGRLRVSTPWTPDETADAVPIQLDGLARWDVGDRLIRDVLAGAEPAAAMTAEQLRGLLPPRELGVAVLEDVVRAVRPLVDGALHLRSGEPRTVDVDIDLGDRRVTGTVDDLFGNALVTVSYSSLAAKHRIAGWVDALALAAGLPEENWTVHTLGRYRAGGRVARVGPLPEHEARAWLRELVDVRERGLAEPVPLPLKTSLAFAEEHLLVRQGRGEDADARAGAQWTTPRFSDTGIPTEDADAWHRRAFGDRAPYSLLAAPTRPDERWNDAPHRLGQYAWRVWGPLLEGREAVHGL